MAKSNFGHAVVQIDADTRGFDKGVSSTQQSMARLRQQVNASGGDMQGFGQKVGQVGQQMHQLRNMAMRVVGVVAMLREVTGALQTARDAAALQDISDPAEQLAATQRVISDIDGRLFGLVGVLRGVGNEIGRAFGRESTEDILKQAAAVEQATRKAQAYGDVARAHNARHQAAMRDMSRQMQDLGMSPEERERTNIDRQAEDALRALDEERKKLAADMKRTGHRENRQGRANREQHFADRAGAIEARRQAQHAGINQRVFDQDQSQLQDMFRRQEMAKTQAVEDPAERQQQQLRLQYLAERAEIEKTGNTAAIQQRDELYLIESRNIETARQAAQAREEEAQARKEAADAARQAAEEERKRAAQAREQAQVEQANLRLSDQIATEKARLELTGVAQQKRLLEIEEPAALRRAMQSGEDAEGIRELFSLRRQALDRSQNTARDFAARTTGTFGSRAVERAFQQTETKAEKSLKNIERNTEAMRDVQQIGFVTR